MDLYEAIVVLNNGSNYRACITENFRCYLAANGMPYRCTVGREPIEIQLDKFRKVEECKTS